MREYVDREFVIKTRAYMDEMPDEFDQTVKQDYYGTLHEPIVRCAECKHYTPNGVHQIGDDDGGYCVNMHGYLLHISPDGFCAWGERKEDGDD